MNTHTPTPWAVDHEGNNVTVRANGMPLAEMWMNGMGGRAADAAFIVTACNAHDALVAFVTDVAVHFAITDEPLGLRATALLAKVKL